MRVEDLFEQGSAGARMAAEQGKLAWWLRSDADIEPTLQEAFGNVFFRLFHVGLHGVQSSKECRGTGKQESFGFEKGGHGFVVTRLTIQERAQFIQGFD